jgi:hypothetical protein
MSYPAQPIESVERGPPGWGLWLGLLGPPVSWALHFMASYVLTEFGCASGWGDHRLLGLSSIAIVQVALSLGALAAIGLAGLLAWRGAAAGGQQPAGIGQSLGRAGVALGALLALVAAPCLLVLGGLAGLLAWRGMRGELASGPPAEIARSMGRAGAALALLFGLVVTIETIPPLVLGGCG